MRVFLLSVVLFSFISNHITGQFVNDTATFTKYRFGSYGEVIYQRMDFGPDRYNYPDGAQPAQRAIIGLPRVIFSFDYKFRNDIEFVSELEIEHGGTGSALELEYEEAGEYEAEIEKAGEVMLEQLYISKKFSDKFKIKAGHMIVPVGRLNMYHLPIQFFGTVRPEGEVQVIPTTWHETGIAVSGILSDWQYELQCVNGLDANGFSRSGWVRTGYQRIFEDTKASQMAFVLRIDNHSIRNTTLSVSAYHGNSAKNTAKPEKLDGYDGTVSIVSSDGEFNNRRIIARYATLYGNVSDAYEIGAINQTLSKNIQYQRTPFAQNAITYSFEFGYDIFTHFRTTGKMIPFARFEYYNTMEKTTGGILADTRFKRNVVTAGINYFPLPNLAIKADYAMRIIDNGNYNQENTIGLALVYSTFFIQK